MRINKKYLILALILVLTLGFKFIAAYNTHVSTDEMIYSLIPLNIISAGRLGTIEQSTLYFYLADIGYQFFGGITPVSVRFFQIIFGSLAILVVYLISLELFNNKKSALLSLFLVAFSGYILKSNIEPDMPAFFFALLSMLFFIKYIKGDNNLSNFLLTGIFFSLALQMKNIVAFFLPAYILVYFIYFFKNNSNMSFSKKEEIKRLILVILVVLISLTPVFIYNYLLFQETGKTDYYFSNALGFGENSHGRLENKPWSLDKSLFSSWNFVLTLFKLDFLIIIFGILGLIFYFNKNKSSSILIILSTLTLVVYVAGVTGWESHFLWIPMILSIFAGHFVVNMMDRFKFSENKKKLIYTILIILVISNSVFILNNIIKERKNSVTLNTLDFVNENIPSNAIILIDPRVYIGIHAWVFNQRNYIDGSRFILSLANMGQDLKEIPFVDFPMYLIECMPGSYCGWKPEDFEKAQKMVDNYFAPYLYNDFYDVEEVGLINTSISLSVLKGTANLPFNILDIISQNKVFYGNPVGWENLDLALDNYSKDGFNGFLHKTGMFIFYLNVLFSIISIFYVFYLFRLKR